MAVEILTNGDLACLFCNTTDFAFGPVVSWHHGDAAAHIYITPEDYLLGFLRWLPADSRTYSDDELAQKRLDFDEHCASSAICLGCNDVVTMPAVRCDECALEYEEERLESLCPGCHEERVKPGEWCHDCAAAKREDMADDERAERRAARKAGRT